MTGLLSQYLPAKHTIGDLLCNRMVGRLVKHLSPRLSRGGLVLDIEADIVPAKTAAALYFRLIERSERDVVSSVLSPDFPVIELGCGVGSVTQAIAEHIGPDCRILCVEANPGLATWWKANLASSDRKNIEFLSVAVTRVSGEAVRFIVEPALLGSRVSDAFAKDFVMVEGQSITDIHRRSGFGAFSLVCDIEGAEFSLLESSSGDMLAQCQSIVMEMHPDAQNKTADLIELFAAHGLRLAASRHSVFGFRKEAQ